MLKLAQVLLRKELAFFTAIKTTWNVTKAYLTTEIVGQSH